MYVTVHINVREIERVRERALYTVSLIHRQTRTCIETHRNEKKSSKNVITQPCFYLCLLFTPDVIPERTHVVSATRLSYPLQYQCTTMITVCTSIGNPTFFFSSVLISSTFLYKNVQNTFGIQTVLMKSNHLYVVCESYVIITIMLLK